MRSLPNPLLLAVLALGACGTTSSYVWADKLPESSADRTVSRIGPRDLISIKVFNQEAMSLARARVRDDGWISMPFLNDVSVEGQTPGELAAKLEVELQKFVVKPVVTVTLDEPAAVSVSVLGEVARAGAYDLRPGAGVLDALAVAGGLTNFASRDGIYVLRRMPGATTPTRIRFRYAALLAAEPASVNFRLRLGDVLVVE